ncbi:MAG: 2-isopropylmalate synthase [Oscillospiraceae bacterium]|nr:2-isopropylmalate synthase [Oscillospiraceae bacterium]
MNYAKYKAAPKFNFPERTWPDKELAKAPIWCSSDLRDGNQALPVPMNIKQKIEFFKLLCEIGFKEIEISFPSASDTDYELTRRLIEEDLIPDGVCIQVLVQSREDLIQKTFESLNGAKKAIVHLYVATSPLHRDVVFQKSREEVRAMAATGAELFNKYAEIYGRDRFIFEFSPEVFTSTEMEYAAEVCNAVLDVWKPSPERRAIINLPSTVELSSPNIYADQIEYMCKNLKYRESIAVSLHAHNDRGCGVAATELGLLAGADRVEGTLFGNGERTGNADIVVLALNMYTHGIDPGLDFSNMDRIESIYRDLTAMTIHPRQPYAGELVFTAFSGSHQDAIRKGMAYIGNDYDRWEMPYLPINPADLGKTYEAIIRVNSQSGKGGVSFILEQKFGIKLSRAMQKEFGGIATRLSDQSQNELSPEEIRELFDREYINIAEPYGLVSYKESNNGATHVDAVIKDHGEEKHIQGDGNGLLDAFCKAFSAHIGAQFDIVDYSEHSLDLGTDSRAISYIQILDAGKESFFGAGISHNISRSSVRAVVSAVNRMAR